MDQNRYDLKIKERPWDQYGSSTHQTHPTVSTPTHQLSRIAPLFLSSWKLISLVSEIWKSKVSSNFEDHSVNILQQFSKQRLIVQFDILTVFNEMANDFHLLMRNSTLCFKWVFFKRHPFINHWTISIDMINWSLQYNTCRQFYILQQHNSLILLQIIIIFSPVKTRIGFYWASKCWQKKYP